jgi:Arc/MetJ-type ribon-helix-helix transcriptional regulator
MATVRLDVTTEATLKRLSARRGQTQSEVLRDAIARIADEEEGEQLSAYQRLQPFVGIADSGGKQLSEGTGKRLRELLEEKRNRARRPG